MFKVINPCACCGGEADGMADKRQVGSKDFCSTSCLMIHGQHFRDALRSAMREINRKFYG